jgi:hypothetical protein
MHIIIFDLTGAAFSLVIISPFGTHPHDEADQLTGFLINNLDSGISLVYLRISHRPFKGP